MRKFYSHLLCFCEQERPWKAWYSVPWREHEVHHDEHSSPHFSEKHDGHTIWSAKCRRYHGSLPKRREWEWEKQLIDIKNKHISPSLSQRKMTKPLLPSVCFCFFLQSSFESANCELQICERHHFYLWLIPTKSTTLVRLTPFELKCRRYFEVVEVVPSIQVYTLWFLVDGHDSQANIKGAMQLPSLDLKQRTFCILLITHSTNWVCWDISQNQWSSCLIFFSLHDLHLAGSSSILEVLSPKGSISETNQSQLSPAKEKVN